jgi:SAM-dependent methyltransferase
MNTFDLLRSIYRRLRGAPFIGPLVEAVRYRRFPVLSTAKVQYEQQQVLIEAHGYALSGLRQAAAAMTTLQTQHLGEMAQEMASLRALVAHAQAVAQDACAQQLHALNLRHDEARLALAQQFEFQRKELLLEMRYSAPTQTPAPNAPPAARILNTEKVNAQRAQGALRLNVGCGHKPETERLNVDMRELPGVDIVASADQLPFAAGELAEIFSSHVLEHFPLEQLRRQLLPAWVRLLRPGGVLRAIVPDAHAMLQAHAQGDLDFETLRLITFGGQEYEGDFHHTMFSPHSLAALLTEVGLTDIRVEASGRRNGLCLEFEMVGTKP